MPYLFATGGGGDAVFEAVEQLRRDATPIVELRRLPLGAEFLQDTIRLQIGGSR